MAVGLDDLTELGKRQCERYAPVACLPPIFTVVVVKESCLGPPGETKLLSSLAANAPARLGWLL